MELSFDNINTNSLSKEFVLSKISELDVFKFYCHNFKELSSVFCSELREDKHPSAMIYIDKFNSIKYWDFSNGDSFNCFDYVMSKYSCTFIESLNIISNDFNLSKSVITLEPRIITANDEFKAKNHINTPKEKSIINIIHQPWTIEDFNYWNQYKIPLDKLEEFDVFSAKYVYLIKGNKRITFNYSKINPCYAYRFETESSYSYKIYWPLSSNKRYKWLFSGGSANDIEGFFQLPFIGDTLVLTKSLKDVICFNLIDIPSISLQGEANKIDSEFVFKILKRFDRIITVYDNDEEGIKGANRFNKQFGFKYFFIDKPFKDLSDYIKANGLNKAKEMINRKLENI